MTSGDERAHEPGSPGREFEQFVDLVAYLRSDEGCPWDREQTLDSMVEHVREETEEVIETIEAGDLDGLQDELGDLLLQVVFLSQIAREQGFFDIRDVLRDIREKLRRRHPHVFGDEQLETPEEVLERWDEIKRKESR